MFVFRWKGLLFTKCRFLKSFSTQVSEALKNSMKLESLYAFKGDKRNTRKRCEICSKLKMKTPELSQVLLSSVFIVDFEQVLHLFLVFLLLLTLNMLMFAEI